MAISQELQTALDAYATHLKASYGDDPNGRFGIEFEEGNKYVKVVHVTSGVGRSSHSFVVKKADAKFKVGDILKSACWNSPAKNFARGNVLEGKLSRTTWTGAN